MIFWVYRIVIPGLLSSPPVQMDNQHSPILGWCYLLILLLLRCASWCPSLFLVNCLQKYWLCLASSVQLFCELFAFGVGIFCNGSLNIFLIVTFFEQIWIYYFIMASLLGNVQRIHWWYVVCRSDYLYCPKLVLGPAQTWSVAGSFHVRAIPKKSSMHGFETFGIVRVVISALRISSHSSFYSFLVCHRGLWYDVLFVWYLCCTPLVFLCYAISCLSNRLFITCQKIEKGLVLCFLLACCIYNA